jgi:hypothetical protein
VSPPAPASPLAAAAAALWPARAAALLARGPDPAATAEAVALAARPRAARLAALAAALRPPQPSPDAIRTAAAAERPRLRAVVAAACRTGLPAPGGRGPSQAGPPAAPLLARLAWERIAAVGDRGDRATVPP